MESYNEKKLVKQAQQGNHESLSQLLHYNYNKVYGFLVKLTLNKDLASDITQESIAKAIYKLEYYDPLKSSFSTWLIQIAINTSRDWYRKENKKVKKRIFNVNTVNMSHFSSDNIFAIKSELGYDKDDMLDVILVLKRMPVKIRLPIILKYYYGYEQSEIAQFLRVPKGTIKSRLSNGLKRIRKELNVNENQ